MGLKSNKVFACIICAFLGAFVLQAQQESTKTDREVIIIERTIDENGNEISKTITRKRGNEIDDLVLEKLLQGGDDTSKDGGFDWKRLGFDPNNFERFDQLFGNNEKGNIPTLGLHMNFEEDRAKVVEVVKSSGASESDIRPGDYILSINGSPISTYEDVRETIEGKEVGDKVRMVVLRDGQEIEKMVELRKNRFRNFQFAFPEEYGGRNFFFDFDGNGNLNFDMDSLLQLFNGRNWKSDSWGNDEEMPNFSPFKNRRDYDGSKSKDDKPKLGVFIDDLEGDGVLVTEVIRHSAADLAGLKEGDVIKKIGEEVITSFADLSAVLATKQKGDTMLFEIERRQKLKKVEVKLK